MLIETKYNPGDKIKFRRSSKTEVLKDCPCCGGDGVIIGKDGMRYECGKCGGYGYYSENKSNEVIDEDTIRFVCVEKNRIYYRLTSWANSYIDLKEEDIIGLT